MVPNEAPAHRPTVLVVEDEVMLLMVVAETLRDAGYNVWEASNGELAVDILKSRPDIELLISDIKMPGMNGYQVADFGLSLRPDLKVLLMTGYAQDPLPQKIRELGIQVLRKPFDFDQLPGLAETILLSKQ
jgi:CheY-like chemotaxis protein